MKVDARHAVIEPRKTAPQRQKWEYRSEQMERDADLSQFGAEGWELVVVAPDRIDPVMAMFYFRRAL